MSLKWLEEVKIQGRRGLYGLIDTCGVGDTIYGLMEHNTYGDETAYVVVKLPVFANRKTVKLKNGKTVTYILEGDEICETFDDIITALEDEEIITINDGYFFRSFSVKV